MEGCSADSHAANRAAASWVGRLFKEETGMETYRNLIIGSGEAGKYLAWTLASQGQKTMVVERRYIGGSCPNIACLPSKNIIYSARAASLRHRGADFGLPFNGAPIDAGAVFNRKRGMIRDLIAIHERRYHETGAQLVMGHARLAGPRTVEVELNGGGTRNMEAERVFLNVGTRAAVPEIPGLAAAAPMTHVEALDANRIPEHLIILGGGYVGLEMAQAFRRLGSHVTVIERSSQLAPQEDEDTGEALLNLFRDEGISVCVNTKLLGVQGHSGNDCLVKIEVAGSEQTVQGTDILVAVGRVPNTDGLGLEAAGVELDTRGYVRVNHRLETSAPDVWAMGDCAGSPHFTHVSLDDFRIVRDNLAGAQRSTKDRLVPFCMFTDPELARVGLTEKGARQAGIPYQVGKIPGGAVLRTRTLGETRGFVKALVEPSTGRILGLTAFLAEASEVMGIVQMAMLSGTPYTLLQNAIWTHPTAAEGVASVFGALQ
jgi:pyruvate/2-oxoglutarate dehydrogenase complex dihydrolipoamide dehydrogenase (E3) component